MSVKGPAPAPPTVMSSSENAYTTSEKVSVTNTGAAFDRAPAVDEMNTDGAALQENGVAYCL
jgi:hypothetical protein